MTELILYKFKRYLIAAIIFVLTVQTTFSGSLFKLEKVKAASENITQIQFTTDAQSIDQNEVSSQIIAETQNESAISENVSEATTLTLSTTSATGQFSLDGVTGWSGPTKQITMDSDTTDKNFYYKDSKAGTFNISVLAPDHAGWTNTPQAITVNDITNPATASVSIPQNGSYYNAASIPTEFSGKAADDNGGTGLNANSTTFYIKNSLNQYWNGSVWTETKTWIAANHLATINGEEVAWSSSAAMPATWADGTYKAQAKATDKSGNVFTGQEITFYFDNTAPTNESITINSGEGVTNDRDVNLTLSATGATRMMIWGDGDFQVSCEDEWIDYATQIDWTLSETNSLKTVHAKFADAAGNISEEAVDTIYYSSDSNTPVETPIPTSGEYSAINAPEFTIDTDVTEATFMTVSRYTQNPTSALPAGITTLGKYYDFSMPDSNKVQLPITIKIYYTQEDLLNADINDENKLQGIYYWDFDSSSWKLFSDSGVVTTDSGEYAGYIWAEVNDFSIIALTPLSGGADITAPVKPANLKATSGNGEVALTWDKRDDAVGYYVRYRQTTSNDNDPYTTIFLSGSDIKSAKITGLTNNVEYEFGVSAKDKAGNISEYAVVTQKPIASEGTSTETTKTLRNRLISTALAIGTNETAAANSNSQNEEIKNNDEGAVESTSDEQNETNWTRFLVTLGIILLAAGAGLGGYYGYQWWMGSEEEKQETKVDTKKDKKNKRDNRW